MIWWLYINERLLTFFISANSGNKPLVIRTRRLDGVPL